MKKIFFVVFIFFNILIFPVESNANTIMQLKTDYSELNFGEEFSVTLGVTGDKVSAIDLEIYFDSEKIEYISGPENSNYVDGRIKLAWYDENGKGKTDFNLGNFIFKQKQKGKTYISIKGEAYNEEGEIINTEFKNLQIGELKEDNKQEKIIAQEEIGTSTDENNALLKILRTNQEEIIPKFETNIKEYYLTTNEDINKLDITAIPDNPNSTVDIIGNKDFKQGKNIVEIKVTSQNGKNINSYKINITKTKDLEKSNTNLENLAIENLILYPSFDTTVTEYKVYTEPSTEKLNILAIPENPKATITIQGNDLLKTGDNEILINVLAEDKINSITYKITAHKRNSEEQQRYLEQEKEENEKLEVLLENVNAELGAENIDNQTNSEENIFNRLDIKYLILFIIIFIVIILFILNYKKNKTKK